MSEKLKPPRTEAELSKRIASVEGLVLLVVDSSRRVMGDTFIIQREDGVIIEGVDAKKDFDASVRMSWAELNSRKARLQKNILDQQAAAIVADGIEKFHSFLDKKEAKCQEILTYLSTHINRGQAN